MIAKHARYVTYYSFIILNFSTDSRNISLGFQVKKIKVRRERNADNNLFHIHPNSILHPLSLSSGCLKVTALSQTYGASP